MIFFERLYSLLVKNGFSASHTNSYHHPIAGFTKEEGSAWHVVLVANIGVISFEEFMRASYRYTRFYSGLKEDKRPTTIFITNVLVTETQNQEISDYIQNLKPFASEPVNNIYWNLVLETGQLILNKSQPTEILNLRKIIQDSYQSEVFGIMPINHQTARTTPLTLTIIILNIIMYLIVMMNGGITTQNLTRFGALVPHLIFGGEYYRLFSAMFLHAGGMHLALNMFSLYIFGTRVERYYNRSSFAIIYTVSGLMGSVASLMLSQTISVGASGAIFGMAGAVAVMAKHTKRDLDGLNFHTMLMFIIINLAFGFTMANVDNFGHIGGLLGGIFTGQIMCYSRFKRRRR